MQAHVNTVDVQQNACAALGLLATNEDNQAAIRNSGAIPAIIAGLHVHSRSSRLMQETACWALQNVAENEHSQAVIAKAGGIASMCGSS